MKIASGVEGFDEMAGGGINRGFAVLLTGEVGTGKTIFGMQFLCHSKENGIYMSFEEDAEQLRGTGKQFGWDIPKLEKEKKFTFVKFDPYRLEDILEVLENSIRETGAKRIVIDSVSALGIYMREISDLRRTIVQMCAVMKKNDCTALLLSEMPRHDALSRFGVEEFAVDGVIAMQKITHENEYRNVISIPKMRQSNHSKKIHHYDITHRGVVVRK